MYSVQYTTSSPSTELTGEMMGFLVVVWILSAVVSIFMLVCMWRLFTKAGKPGWASIVPIYNMIVMLEIAGLPTWYILWSFVPFANIWLVFRLYIDFARAFGKSTGFGVLMVFFSVICVPILAFGSAAYGDDDAYAISASDAESGAAPEYDATAAEAQPMDEPATDEPSADQPDQPDSQA